MRDKRKVFFCLICIVITIVFEVFLYRDAKLFDVEYKKMMDSKLSNVVKELEERNFKSKNDYHQGALEYERNIEGWDYGYIFIQYDIWGNIEDISIKLEYSNNLYIDDIFYDSYYIFNLLGINILNEYNFDSDLANNFSMQDEIIVDNNKFNYSINRTNENKIQFEIK